MAAVWTPLHTICWWSLVCWAWGWGGEGEGGSLVSGHVKSSYDKYRYACSQSVCSVEDGWAEGLEVAEWKEFHRAETEAKGMLCLIICSTPCSVRNEHLFCLYLPSCFNISRYIIGSEIKKPCSLRWPRRRDLISMEVWWWWNSSWWWQKQSQQSIHSVDASQSPRGCFPWRWQTANYL